MGGKIPTFRANSGYVNFVNLSQEKWEFCYTLAWFFYLFILIIGHREKIANFASAHREKIANQWVVKQYCEICQLIMEKTGNFADHSRI